MEMHKEMKCYGELAKQNKKTRIHREREREHGLATKRAELKSNKYIH